MLDIKFVRENPDAVKENIKKKFQDAKLPLVDEVIEKDAKYRAALKEVEALKAARNKLSKANGPLFGQLKKCTDEAQKAELQAQIDEATALIAQIEDDMENRRAEYEQLRSAEDEASAEIERMIAELERQKEEERRQQEENNKNNGGNTGGEIHWHPPVTPAPVPVVVIPPKTGDMTIWQSILHFFGVI